MDPALALRGFVLGFTIAAAVGPISLLVIRRTLAEGQRYGLVSGLGVATADATYGAIAAFGLSAITDVLVNARQVLGLVGGVFLLWLAWRTIRSTPTEAATVTDGAPGLCRGVPLDPRSDPGQPDDDPVVRGVVRGSRRDERRDRRCGARRPRRPPRLDDLVDRPDDRRRDVPRSHHAASGCTGSTSSPASIIGAFAIVAIASVLVPVAGRP